MAQTEMNVTLMAHTQLSEKFSNLEDYPDGSDFISVADSFQCTDGQAVALSAIRTCYSPNKPSEIVAKEGSKYFGKKATDGEGGTDADRLIRMIMRSGHLSTVEHLTFTFAIEGVSRALLAQLTRHRAGFSYSVQSQRYVKMGSGDKSGGFDYVMPEKVAGNESPADGFFEDEYGNYLADPVNTVFEDAMDEIQRIYDSLREAGIPGEDARAVLPNASACNLVLTGNLRALLDFYSKRRKGRGGQHEITELAEALRREVTEVEPWTDKFFEEA